MSLFPLWVCFFQIYSVFLKLEVINNGNFQIVVSLLYAHYPICSFYHANSIAMLYIVHTYEKKFETTNTDLTHLYFLTFY